MTMDNLTMDSSIPVIPLPPGLSWTYIISPIGPIGMAATPKGVCRVLLDAGPRWAQQCFGDRPIHHVFPHAFPGGKAIVAYFNGLARDLTDVPVDPGGTPFQQAVWAATRAIPFGETRSYGQIARIIGNPHGAQAVGQALGANPVPLLTPCHRVLAAAGKLGGFTGGIELKQQLLAMEAAPTREGRATASGR